MNKFERRLRRLERARAKPLPRVIEFDLLHGIPDFPRTSGRGLLAVPRVFASADEWQIFAESHLAGLAGIFGDENL